MSDTQFGYFLSPTAQNPKELIQQARLCESLGFDLIGIMDHPYVPQLLDTWTLISVLAAHTERIRFFPDVANLPLRPPAVLAKSAATLDLLAGGRIELGLGAGSSWQGIVAMGGTQRKPREAVAALEEAIQVVRLVWSGQRGARFKGEYYQLQGAHTGPVPAHPIGIWIGAYKPRMLALTGRLGDGWVPSSSYIDPGHLPAMNRQIDEAAQSAGRDPRKIRRVLNVFGRITGGEQAGFLEGPVLHWVDELLRMRDEGGMDTFIFGPQEATEEQVRRFAEEVIPAVKTG